MEWASFEIAGLQSMSRLPQPTAETDTLDSVECGNIIGSPSGIGATAWHILTFRPRPPIPGVEPKTIQKPTATEAWMEYQQLTASDEEVDIRGPSGTPMEWQELRMLAEKEAN